MSWSVLCRRRPTIQKEQQWGVSRQDLSTFISTSILPKTNWVYEKEWLTFKAFVKDEPGSSDPFLTSYVDDERAALVALMMMRRHQAGKRGKSACAFMAAVRQMFARTMRSTAFFDSAIIATARTSCSMQPNELRALKDNGPPTTVKLPICEDMGYNLPIQYGSKGSNTVFTVDTSMSHTCQYYSVYEASKMT